MEQLEHRLLGASAGMQALRDQLSRLVARQAAPGRRLPPILIQGETGTGKGLVAQAIHRTGPRAAASFVDVNCAAIPDTLLEAEIFGFERGAFTDARHAKAGLLQTAHRGSIFLDEIGLMPDGLQVKLLKAIEEGSVRRLGSTRAEPVDAWILAATSEDLQAAIRARRFREDLYHRLAVVTLRLPPLRERGEDILLLARHFLTRACADFGVPPKTLTPDAEAALDQYSWPGNVRELANVMERVTLLCETARVAARDLGLTSTPASAAPAASASVDDQVAALERSRIEEALHADGWNISRAATRLGIPRNTLRYRMERHGLAPDGAPPVRRRGSKPDAAPAAGGRAVASSGTSEPEVRWQRRRITLLRADVGDSGAGPSESDRSRTLDELAAKAASFGGRIVERSATRLVAAFGLEPVEDAPRHAAHAALAMRHAAHTAQPAMPMAPPEAIVMHAGELLVGRLGARVEIEADSRRAAQAVLAEVRTSAPTEPMVLSAGMVPFLDRDFRLEPIPGSLCGGRPVWRLLGRLDLDARVTPFVARARELALLEERFAQARDGDGHAVLLVGEPGIGNSRLLRELRRRTRGQAGWMEGHATSFGRALPFHPLTDLLRRTFRIEDSDAADAIGEKLERAVLAWGEDLGPTLPFLRYLLSLDPGDPSVARLDPKLRRAGMFDAVRQLLLAASRAQPLIVVLEDVHWMDQATAEFLALLAESAASGRILLLVTHRPGFSLPLAESAFQARLTLPRLSSTETRDVAAALLDVPTLPADLQRLLEAKTEGNPFFVEEVLRSLQEHGLLARRGEEVVLTRPVESLDVPDTVQDVILARLERLDPPARDLLHVAAVIGRAFPQRVLDRVAPEAAASGDDLVRALKAADLVLETQVWPEVAYAFKHALTHEVAYLAQRDDRRRDLHARIGEAIEQIYADRLAEQHGVLAHHFMRAERWDKALAYLLETARQAERSFATREALALYDEAQTAAERLGGGAGTPATVMAIHEAKARLHFVMSEFDRSAAEGERILPLARLTGDRAREGEALATIAWANTWCRDLDGAIRVAREAIAVAEPAGASAVQGRAHFIIGFVRGVTGVFEESHQSLGRAITLAGAAGDAVHQSLALSSAGLLQNWYGDYAAAARLQDEGLALARDRGLLVPLLFSTFLRGLTLTGRGHYDEAFDTFQEGLHLAERVGDEAIHHRLLNCLGWLYAELGDLDRAYALNATSARIGRRRRDPGTQPNAEINMGDILLARGELAHAQEVYDGVYRYWKDPSASEWMRFRYSIRLFASMGELALARGDLAAARAHGAQCLDLAARTGSKKNLVKGHRLAGDVARAAREWDRAEEHLRLALHLASIVGNPVQQWQTHLALARLFEETGRLDAARAATCDALTTVQAVHERLRHADLRATFDRAPVVRQLRAREHGA